MEKALFEFMFSTGCRIGEIVSLDKNWAGTFLKEYLSLIYRINNNEETEIVDILDNLCNQLEVYLSSIPRYNAQNSVMISGILSFPFSLTSIKNEESFE